jgi:hypothetical protein
MSALTRDQLEILQRAHDGVPIWGGSVATGRLRREVELLFAIGLLEQVGADPYKLTELGAQILRKKICPN